MEEVRSTATMGRMPEATRFIPADYNGYAESESSRYCGRPLPMPIWRSLTCGHRLCFGSDIVWSVQKCLTRYLVSCSPYENGWLRRPAIGGGRTPRCHYSRCGP